MVFNRDLKHYENFTLMSHFVAQPAEMTHIGFVNKIYIIGKGMIKETWSAKIKEIGCWT